MVAPVINDGSPVHGYNLFKYHTSSPNVVSVTGSTALWQAMRSYSYLSGTANDGLLVNWDFFQQIVSWDPTVGTRGQINIRQSGAGVTDTVIGSIYIQNDTGNQTQANHIVNCLFVGSVNQDFDLIMEGRSVAAAGNMNNYLWSVISF